MKNVIVYYQKDFNPYAKYTINFAKKLNPDIAKFHILKPYPGTEIFNQLKQDGLIIEFDYNDIMFSFEEFAVLAYDNPNNKTNVLFTNLKDEPFEW